jgi:regulator of RNase E activity RraA
MAARSEDHLNVTLPTPPISRSLPISGPSFARPDPNVIEQLYQVGSATASALLHKMGVRQTFIQGPLPRRPGSKVVGPVVTLQFMPQREDVASGLAQEHVEKVSALWAVFDTVQPGDIMIADDDGAVLVPAQMAPLLLEHASAHEDWEVFSRIKLAEGGSLAKYYPLNDEGWAEYEHWKSQGTGD